jgi:hypothetical protein
MKTFTGLLIITISILSNNSFGQASCEDLRQQIDTYNQKIESTNTSIEKQKREVSKYTGKIEVIPEFLQIAKSNLQTAKEQYEKVKNNQRLVRWPGWPDEITNTFNTEVGDISISVNGSDTVSITAPENIKGINVYFKTWSHDGIVELRGIEKGQLMQTIPNLNTKSGNFVLSKDIPVNMYINQEDFIFYNTMDIILNNNKIIQTTFRLQVDKETNWGQGY